MQRHTTGGAFRQEINYIGSAGKLNCDGRRVRIHDRDERHGAGITSADKRNRTTRMAAPQGTVLRSSAWTGALKTPEKHSTVLWISHNPFQQPVHTIHRINWTLWTGTDGYVLAAERRDAGDKRP